MEQTSQISATIPSALKDRIIELAKENKRSFSEMCAILLDAAYREKTRKRKTETA